MNRHRGITFAWLGHPSTVVALAVLLVNDHLLKAAWPGPVTGKLSDAAGLVLAPPLLAVLATLIAPRLAARRSGIAAILTVAITFGLIKTFPYAAERASALWSLITPSLVRADVTDLLTLPALLVSAWSLRRACRTPSTPGPRTFRALRVAVLLPLALAGVAATSAVPVLDATHVVSAGDAIYLARSDNGPQLWVVSRDDGRTWAVSPPPDGFTASDNQRPASTDCAGDVCYRVLPHAIGVQTRTGAGEWTTSWQLTDKQRRWLYRAYPDLWSMESQLSSEGLAVHEIAGGGYEVIVSNGRDGFAMRDASGHWHRIGFPGPPDRAIAPHRLPGDPALNEDAWLAATVAIFFTGLALIAAGALAATRGGAAGRTWTALLPLLLTGPPMLIVALVGRVDPHSILTFGASGIVAAPVLWLVTGVTLAGVLANAGRRLVRPRRWFALLGGATALTTAAQLVIYLIWQQAGAERGLILLAGYLAVFPLTLLAVLTASARAEPRPRLWEGPGDAWTSPPGFVR